MNLPVWNLPRNAELFSIFGDSRPNDSGWLGVFAGDSQMIRKSCGMGRKGPLFGQANCDFLGG
jgi:hypothetical protein